MGRRPKGAPKDIPLGPNQLTEKQAHLLAWVYLEGYKELDRSEITWSPKAYLRKSPTKSEAATLSKRVNTLIEHGLLHRHGRTIEITSGGKNLLYIYALEKPDAARSKRLSIRLGLDETVQDLGAYSKVFLALTKYRGGESGLSAQEAQELTNLEC